MGLSPLSDVIWKNKKFDYLSWQTNQNWHYRIDFTATIAV